MYIRTAIIEGLKILGFDKETIKSVSREKSLEEIFLTTLFLNYILVLIAYVATFLNGGFFIEGREVNMPVFFGILLAYPFMYNVVAYVLYGFFGLMAELLDKKRTVKPLISVGFHTAIVYTFIIFIIGLLSSFSVAYGAFLFGAFGLYFLYTLFLTLTTIYNFSFGQTLIVIFIPFIIIGLFFLLIYLMIPSVITSALNSLVL